MVYSITYITAQLTGPVFQSRESQDLIERAKQYYKCHQADCSIALHPQLYR